MSRRLARERSLQILFQVDLGGNDPAQAIQYMNENFGALEKNNGFVDRLIKGTLENLNFLDMVIGSISKDWNIGRMAIIDRNIMRLALYEILYCRDIPSNVSVNEAIELGKIYGGEESSRFINGILGKVLECPEQYLPPAQH